MKVGFISSGSDSSSSTHYKLHELLAQSRDEELHQVYDKITQLVNEISALDTPYEPPHPTTDYHS